VATKKERENTQAPQNSQMGIKFIDQFLFVSQEC